MQHMHMHFYFDTDIGDFFISGFEIKSTGGFIFLCFVLFLLSVCYEGLKVHKAKSKAKTAREQRQQRASMASENATLLSDNQSSSSLAHKPLIKKVLDSLKDLTTFIFTNVLNYFLMLTVMLYNGYLFISVVLGFTVGYFMFGHMSMKINMENLQAIQSKMICSASCRQPDEGHSSATLSSYQNASIPSVSEQITTETALQRLPATSEQKIENYGSTSCH